MAFLFSFRFAVIFVMTSHSTVDIPRVSISASVLIDTTQIVYECLVYVQWCQLKMLNDREVARILGIIQDTSCNLQVLTLVGAKAWG